MAPAAVPVVDQGRVTCPVQRMSRGLAAASTEARLGLDLYLVGSGMQRVGAVVIMRYVPKIFRWRWKRVRVMN